MLDGDRCTFCDPEEGLFVEGGECRNCSLDNCKRCSNASVCLECDEENHYYLKEGEDTCSKCDTENDMFEGG